MNASFNLLDEPWLPVRMSNGQVCELGLLELFERAGQISALAETSPPSLIAQYRLLLAITHRALTSSVGTWKDKDRARWYRDGLPFDVVRNYLETWRERFWLFHPDFPFMQVAALAEAKETCDKKKPWTQIALSSATGATPVLFDHSCDSAPIAIMPAQALRALLGFLQFTPCGLVKTLRDSDKAGPLANTAAVMPMGGALMQSLCLALHPASIDIQNDLPSWERPAVCLKVLRDDPSLASGPNDRYTRLTRAALFLPTVDCQVQWLRFAVGVALGDDLNAPDPMASYRAGTSNLVRLSFCEGRAFWRDLAALLPDAEGKASQPAAVLGWAGNLQLELGNWSAEQPLLIAGLASDRAKLERWRSEQITLPTKFLANPELAGFLRELLRKAEDLFTRVRQITTQMLADTLPDPRSKDTRERARSLFIAGPATAIFFAETERSLASVITQLGNGDLDSAESIWNKTLLTAAQNTWDVLQKNLGLSPIALRAEAKAYPVFRASLRKWQPGASLPVDSMENRS